jgi:hypothetical protein
MLSTTGTVVNTACTSLLVTEYPANFKIISEDQVFVFYVDIAGGETLLLIETDYTIDSITETGFTVNLVTTYETGSLSVRRIVPKIQETEFIPGGDFPASAFEEALDRQMMIVQEYSEKLNRVVTAGLSDEAVDLELPPVAERSLRFPFFDVDGNITTKVGTIPASEEISAADIPIIDLPANYTAEDVEAALAEIADTFGSLSAAAEDITVEDLADNFIGTNAEAVFAEMFGKIRTEDEDLVGNVLRHPDAATVTPDAGDIVIKPAAGGSLLIDGGFSINGQISNLLSYQKDTTARSFTTTIADGWITTAFTVPAGSVISMDFWIPIRNNSTSWGGGYVYLYYDINSSGTWFDLGTSGYGGAMAYQQHIDGYGNTLIQDFSTTTEDFEIRYKFRHKSYDGTMIVNTSNNITGGADSDDSLSYAWSHVIVTSLRATTGPKGDTGAIGDTGFGFDAWDSTIDYGANAVVASVGIAYISLQTPNLNKTPASEPTYWKVAFDLNVTISTSAPSGGSDGDIWYVREA